MAVDSKCLDLACWLLRNAPANREDREDLSELLHEVGMEYVRAVTAREAERQEIKGHGQEAQGKAQT